MPRSIWSHPATPLLLLITASVLLLAPLPQEGRVLDAVGDLHARCSRCWGGAPRSLISRAIRDVFKAGFVARMTALFWVLLRSQLRQARSVDDTAADVQRDSRHTVGCSCRSISGCRRLRLGTVAAFTAAGGFDGVLYDSMRQRRQLPVIASFEDRLEMTRWNPHDASLTRERDRATDGQWALRVDIEAEKYPGAALKWPAPDWSAYSKLVFDAACEEGRELELTVKVEDARHNNQPEDRFQRRVLLSASMTRFEIPLAEIAALPSGRPMDLSRVALLQFYARKPTAPRTFYVDNIRLE
jgi:hypothetical protein